MDYFKVDAIELRPEPGELQLIDSRRTSLVPATVPKRINPAPIRRERNKAARGLIGVTAASLLLNVIQSVIIYVLQAGPIW